MNSINKLSLVIIYSKRVPRPLVTVSMTDIPVLHSAEVVHFHHELWFTLLPEAANLLTHFQGRLVGFTMKSFKGLSNKYSPLRIPHQLVNPSPKVWLTKRQKPKCTPLVGHEIKPIRAPLVPFGKVLRARKGPHTWLKSEPCSTHGCTVSPGDHWQISP
jgi:hypothetical protein